MKKFYRIAGHVVGLNMEPSDPLWGRLDNLRPFACEGGGRPVLEIETAECLPEEPVEVIYTAETEDFPRIEIGRSQGQAWRISLSPLPGLPFCARIRSSGDFSRAALQIADGRFRAFALNSAMMLLFALRTAPLHTLEMHASAVMHGGRGYLFLGRSGTGKSTHSALWLKYIPGSELLNDDNPVIRLQEGRAMVCGSPWSGKTPCYRAESVPAGAIVRIEQAGENRIRRLSLAQAYASVFPSCSGFRPDRTIADGLHAAVSQLVSAVPCYVLECLPDRGAAELCYRTVYG